MAKNKIVYASYIFSDDDETLRSGNEYQITSLIADELQADTIELEVKCNDKNIVVFTENAPLQYYRENLLRSTYYVQSIKQIGDNKYTISADSAMGLLMKRLHAGGIYTGQTVKEVTNEICGNVPVLVKTVFSDTKLYGWLPYCKPPKSSARNNLAQVLYAIGAALTTDNNGVLRVEPLWDGVSSSIGETRMYFDGSVETEKPISAVTVTEHQYVAGTDEKELFSGTSQQGDIITFSEPMHSLTATGFTILESGANYAKISSGSGSLKGKTYIHNTRLVTQTVTENAAENVKSVTDATLVSLVNSSAVAKRLADYYKCRETITNGIVSGQEKPGHVVSVYHPYDKQMVSACIVSLDTTMSGTLKSEMAALVGFLPPQPESSEYFDERVLLTGSGEWTVPEGITEIRAVLIGGGQGGKCGQPGQAATAGRSDSGTSSTSYTTDRRRSVSAQVGGVGGQGGDGGHPGAVYVEDLTPTPGQVIAYACGIGGVGEAYEPTTSPDGADGTATTFGALSSALGSYSDAGYYDTISGETYAAKGDDGIAGGDGGGYDPDSGDRANPRWKTYKGASGVVDHDGTVYAGYKESEITLQTSTSDADNYTAVDFGKWCATAEAHAGRGASGGAAVGMSARKNWAAGSAHTYAHDANSADDKGYAWAAATGGKGSDGASAAAPVKQVRYGCGGYGGNGGGGAGGNGVAEAVSTVRTTGTTPDTARCTYTASWGSSFAVGGAGSDGGQGADGCIILYYRRPKPLSAGWLRDNTQKPLLDRLGRRLIV